MKRALTRRQTGAGVRYLLQGTPCRVVSTEKWERRPARAVSRHRPRRADHALERREVVGERRVCRGGGARELQRDREALVEWRAAGAFVRGLVVVRGHVLQYERVAEAVVHQPRQVLVLGMVVGGA